MYLSVILHLLYCICFFFNFSRFRCRRCSFEASLNNDTWLECVHLRYGTIAQFLYCWAQGYTTVRFCKQELNLSKNTTVNWNNMIREVCAGFLLQHPIQVGGEGKTVEIDETVVSRRKYNRGRMLPTQWVFGGIERESRKVFMYAVPNRTQDVLESCITAHILPGSTIYSDCWPSYNGIPRLEGYNYKHDKVNHSKNFIHPLDSNIHTQCIESNWNQFKRPHKARCGTHRSMLDSYLSEFLWRNYCKVNNLDVFETLMSHIPEFVESFL